MEALFLLPQSVTSICVFKLASSSVLSATLPSAAPLSEGDVFYCFASFLRRILKTIVKLQETTEYKHGNIEKYQGGINKHTRNKDG